MEINFSIPDISQNERDLLKSILHCNDGDLNERLNKVAASSFEEYRKMILGQRVFTRGKDILEYRLFIFIKYYFDGIIPEEQRICDLFQITAKESRALVRSIMSKYQYELRDNISSSIRLEVEKITKDDHSGEFKISIQNQFIKDELNRVLGTIDTSLPIIEKDKGTISTYVIKPSSYQKLCEYYNVDVNE